MAADEKPDDLTCGRNTRSEGPAQTAHPTTKVPIWRQLLGIQQVPPGVSSTSDGSSTDGYDEIKAKPEKWSMGVLNDKETEEVPGKSISLPFCTAASPLKMNRIFYLDNRSSSGLAID